MRWNINVRDIKVMLLSPGEAVCAEYADVYIVMNDLHWEDLEARFKADQWLREVLSHRLVAGDHNKIVIFTKGRRPVEITNSYIKTNPNWYMVF